MSGPPDFARPGPSGRRFHHLFRFQMAAILLTVAGLTVAHFALAAGGLSWLVTNVLFVAGLAIATLVLLASTRSVERQVSTIFARLQSSYLGTVSALSGALEVKDRYTGDHTASVVELATTVGRRLGLPDSELEALHYGALFHDIGKIGIPEAILNKPGPLTPEERVVMERHTVMGEQILAPVEFLAPTLPIVRHEHERWDGRGYPDGLAAEEIPLGARIIFVCDAFHAMTSDRPYRKALPHSEAFRRLREGAGSQFDAQVVEVFLEVLSGASLDGFDQKPPPTLQGEPLTLAVPGPTD